MCVASPSHCAQTSLVLCYGRANARKMSSDFSARAAKPAAPGVDAAARQAPVIAAKPKASTTTAMEILLQRRKYAALHLAPEQGWLTNLSSKNNNSNSNPQVHDGNARLAEESRLALVRALETYDTSIHGAVLSAWNGRGSSAGHASAAMPILSYVSSPVETLGVSDVPKLLAEYKALAKICSVLVMEKLNGAGTFSSDYGRSSN